MCSCLFCCPCLRGRVARMLFTLGLRLRKHTASLGSFEAWCELFAFELFFSVTDSRAS